MGKVNRFATKVNRTVRGLGKEEQCTSLKRHFTGAMARFVGYLEALAALDESGGNFIFAKIETLSERVRRYKGKVYSRRQFFYMLAKARACGVTGEQFVRESDGMLGMAVARHDELFHRVGSKCVPKAAITAKDGVVLGRMIEVRGGAKVGVLRDGKVVPYTDVVDIFERLTGLGCPPEIARRAARRGQK
jgi:hypothetical protein